MSRPRRLIRVPALLLVVTGLLVGGAAYVFALPMYEVNVSYYDESDLLVAQRGITCNGAHWSWGDITLARPGNIWEEKTACSSSTFPPWFRCWYWVTTSGQVVLGGCTSGG